MLQTRDCPSEIGAAERHGLPLILVHNPDPSMVSSSLAELHDAPPSTLPSSSAAVLASDAQVMLAAKDVARRSLVRVLRLSTCLPLSACTIAANERGPCRGASVGAYPRQHGTDWGLVAYHRPRGSPGRRSHGQRRAIDDPSRAREPLGMVAGLRGAVAWRCHRAPRLARGFVRASRRANGRELQAQPKDGGRP